MPLYGQEQNWVRMMVDLRTIGPVPITPGRGIVVVVGTSDRGPTEPTGLGSSTDSELYGGGDLKEAIETIFAQQVNAVYPIRVLGDSYAIASLDVKDGTTAQNVVGTFTATSAGAWGNGILLTIGDGDYKGTVKGTILGDDTAGPYAIGAWDIVEDDTSNWVKVSGVSKTVVYDELELDAGTVWVDPAEGEFTFYVGEEPSTDDQITYGLKFYSKKFTIKIGSQSEVWNNVRTLEKLQALAYYSQLVDFTPAANAVHLPDTLTQTALAGGSDGAAITTADWEDAAEKIFELPDGILPTTIVFLDYEVEAGTYDLVPILDQTTSELADLHQPAIGFVSAKKNEEADKLVDLASGYNNLWLTIVGNGWDDSTTPKNLAAARAGKEAAVALGESTAKDANALNGINGLLWQFKPAEREALTRNGVDVLVKKRGVLPYLAISTATDEPFMRNVDARTIAWTIVALKTITDRWYHHRRTQENLTTIQGNIELFLKEQKDLKNLDAYEVTVKHDPLDRHKVNIHLMIQPVGHIEKFYTVMRVGLFSTEIA